MPKFTSTAADKTVTAARLGRRSQGPLGSKRVSHVRGEPRPADTAVEGLGEDSAQSSRAQRRLNREAKRFGFAEVQEGEDCREPLASGTDSLEVCKVEKEKLGRKVDKLKKRVEELISIAESQQQQIETLANEKKELVDELMAVESHGRVARLTHRAEEQGQQIESLANEKKELAEQLKASEAYASMLFKDNMKFWEALTTERRTVQILNEIIETGECQEGGQGSRLCTPPP